MDVDLLSVETKLTLSAVVSLNLTKDEQEGDEEQVCEALVRLKKLDLSWQGFGAIESVDSLPNAEELHLQFNRIKKLENLDLHVKLRLLFLGHNCIHRIENLNHLKKLQLLDLKNNHIKEVDADEIPRSVRNLDLSGNPCASEPDYRAEILKRLASITVLDNEKVGGPSIAKKETISFKLKPSRAKGPISTSSLSDALFSAAVKKLESFADDALVQSKLNFSRKRTAIREQFEREREERKQRETN